MTVETKISTYLSFHNLITETRLNILNLPQGLIKTTLIYGILRLTKKTIMTFHTDYYGF